MPCHLDPDGLHRTDSERSDGASIVPWKKERILVWDVTSITSHRALASSEKGAVANNGENHKKLKCNHLDSTHTFVLVAVETFGA